MEQADREKTVAGGDGGHGEDPLGWLSSILWPNGGAHLLVDRRRKRPGAEHASVVAAGDEDLRVGFQWWASPSAANAELLIPATSIEAARAAVRRYHDGFTLGRRARSWAAELLMRSPQLAANVLDERLVAATGRVTDGVLTDVAAALAGSGPLDELHVAITLARPKSNRKPVLQLIDQNGMCIGWAKVGWNHWTRTLVDNEAAWLERRPRSPIITPRVLERLHTHEHLVVVSSGVTGSRRPRRANDQPPPPEVVLAIADLGTRTRLPLGETPWWRSVQNLLAHATEREIGAVERVAEGIGSSTIEIGAWHGDLTPWNLMSAPSSRRSLRAGATSGSVQVIDWEFAADGVPLGFDLCHFHTQVGVEMKGLSTSAALDRSARLSPQGLARLGVDPHNQITVYRLYLVELIRRTLALRAAGLPVDGIEQGEAAIERIAGRLPARQAPAPRPNG